MSVYKRCLMVSELQSGAEEVEYVLRKDYDALEADLRIAFGWGDPFDMTPEDAKVWHRLNAHLGREP
jgi:hypothetical protein